MAKAKNAQPAPKVDAINDSDLDGNTPALASNVAHISEGKAKASQPANLFNQVAAQVSQNVQDKMRIMGEARQRLAEAKVLFLAGADEAGKAETVAGQAALSLYQGRTGGFISNDEISGILGDIFGFKPKQDGTPGKTPAGQGEVIRKRLVRAVDAYNYVNDIAATRFFEGLPADKVATVVNGMENGDLPLYTAYNQLADIRKEEMSGERLPAAFDPKAIGKMVEALTEDGAIARILESKALQIAYGELLNVLNEVGQTAAEQSKAA